MKRNQFLNGRPLNRRGLRRFGARGFGGGEAPPPFADTLLMHWVAADVDGVDWVDRVAGVPLKATGSPVLNSNDIYFKGKQTVTFPVGANKFTAVDSPEFPTAAFDTGNYTIVCASRTPDNANQDRLVDFGNDAAASLARIQCQKRGNASLRFSKDAANADGGAGVLAGGYRPYGWGSTGAASTALYSKALGKETAAGSAVPLGIDSVSLGNILQAGNNPSEVTVGECLVYDHELTQEEYDAAVAYLDGRYLSSDAAIAQGAYEAWAPADYDETTGDWVGYIKGITLSQATPSERPTKVTSTRTGHAMLSLDGTDDFLETQDPGLLAVMNGAQTVYSEVVWEGSGVDVAYSAGDSADVGSYHRLLWRSDNGNTQFTFSDGTTSNEKQLTGAGRRQAASWAYGAWDGSTTCFTGAAFAGTGEQSSVALTPAWDRFLVGARVAAAAEADRWEGEIGAITVYSRELVASEHAAQQQAIEDTWTAELPLQLGAFSHIDAEDVDVGLTTWPDRVAGVADFTVQAGTPTEETINGRRAIGFPGSTQWSRVDPSADLARVDSTHMFVYEGDHDLAAGYELITHSTGGGNDNRFSLGVSNTGVANALRRDTASVGYSFIASPAGPGNRQIDIRTFDDATGRMDLYLNGAVNEFGTSVKTLGTPFDRTILGGRLTATPANAWRGKIAAMVAIARVLTAAERQLLEDYAFDRFYDFAIPQGQPGAVDDIALRYNASDYQPAGSWPSEEGTLHPLTLTPVTGTPAKSTAAELNGADVVVFAGAEDLQAVLGSPTPVFDGGSSVLSASVRRGPNASGEIFELYDSGSGERHRNEFAGGSVHFVAVQGSGGSVSGSTVETIAIDAAAILAAAAAADGSMNVRVNGVAEAFAGTAYSALSVDTFTAGVRAAGGVVLTAETAELIAVARKLGDAELQAWARYSEVYLP